MCVCVCEREKRVCFRECVLVCERERVCVSVYKKMYYREWVFVCSTLVTGAVPRKCISRGNIRPKNVYNSCISF